MAVWALLSISQTVKATDVTVYFQCPLSGWTTPVHVYAYGDGVGQNTTWENAPACSEYKTSTGVILWKCTFASKYNRVIFKDNTGKQYPGQGEPGFEVTDNYVYTSTSLKGTSLSDFEKTDSYTYTLIGGYENGSWTSEPSSFKYDGASKYTYTFTAVQTGEFRFRVNTNYASGVALCPNVDGNTKRKELTSTSDAVAYNNQNDASGVSMYDNYWFCKVTKGNNYTFTLTETYNSTDNSYTRKLSVVPEEAVVTKEIKLFNAETEVTGSNGKYTLNLSGDTSQDATITLTIDGAKYGLATAQTISKAGTTSGIAFTTEGTNALTLKAGLIYYLSVTKEGKMKVVAKEKGIADGNYYLVGNFFTEDGDDINYDKKYFRFIDNGDGTLSFDIPTTLTVKAQVLASDGKCYGPTKNGNIGIDNPTADDKTVRGNLVEGSNCFTFTDRELTGDGIYKVTIAVDETGIPTKWTVDFDKTQRMAYFMVDPTEDADAVAHPCYTIKKDDGTTDNKFFGNVYLEANQHCFVVGNIQVNNDDNNTHILKTTPKLYLQGNGGLDITTNTGHITDENEKMKYTNVFPNKEGFYFPKAQSLYLEYNPSQGNKTAPDVVAGIAGEVKPRGGEIPITSIQIVGNGVVGSWELKDAKNMTYNKTLDCWEYSFRTEKAENADNKFRFLANGSWAMNWGEESTKQEDQARTPYKDKTEQGHEASETDPNNLGRTTNGTEENRDGGETHGDMIFNRPAGQWTIRFYIRSVSTEGGNYFEKAYGYTIIGSESNDIDLTYRTGKFIRTYSNSKPMNPDNDNVKIYEVYKYEKPDKVDNIYTQGKVYLRRLNYVPANVGVVLIGEVPDDGKTYTDGQKLVFSLLERTEESVESGGDYRDVWTKATEYKDAGDQWNNYLVPTVTAVNDLGNAQVDESGKVIYRYFGLGNYYRTNYHTSLGNADTQSDYIGFFRLTANGKSGANKAYLSIPANAEVGNAVGATYGYIDYNGQLLGNEYDDSTIPASLAKMALVFDDLVDGNEVTGIKELETENLNNDKYYNLQGIEVAHPVKGIYIHNGKKVIVK